MAAHDRDLLKTPHFCLALQGRSMDAPPEPPRSPRPAAPPASAEPAPAQAGDRPRPVRFAAMLRLRQGAQGGLFRSISRQLRFSRHACPPQPSSQTNNPFHRPFAGALLSREFAGFEIDPVDV